ncbi:MAG: GAF domain-containing protein [Bacteroidales bacterium]|nr:GAF domain-containing protein [Bacteroidales bacterium]
MYLRHLIILLLSLMGIQVMSQKVNHIKFENISTRQGLSQSSPNCILQDSRGILWIGTEDGLNKYDGYDFIIYRPKVNEQGSVSNNRIKCMVEDKNGNLWIGTNGGGLNIYDRMKDSFSVFQGFDSVAFEASFINCLYYDDEGIIWAGTVSGLYKINPAKKTVVNYSNNPFKANTISSDVINTIASDKQGFLLIGTEYGMNRLNTAKELFSWYFHDPSDENSLSDNSVNYIFKDKGNAIWIGTSNGLNLYDDSNDQFERIVLPEHHEQNGSNTHAVTTIAEDTEGNLWIGTFGKGLYIYYKSLDMALNLSYNPGNPYSLSNNEVLSVFRDNSGIMWVGSNGLDKYNPRKEKFTLYNYDPFSSKGEIFRHIHAIYEDDYGVLWIGSKSDGIYILDRQKKQSSRITAGENSLSSNKIRVIREYPEGTLWIGTDDNGLNKITLGNNREPQKYDWFSYNPVASNTLSSNTIYTLHIDGNNLWIGTDNGISKMDINTEEIIRYIPNPEDSNSLNNSTAYYIYGDRAGTIWVATDLGLNKYVPETDGFVHYISDPADSKTLSSNELLTIYEDIKGTLWIGTYSHGINSFDREKEEFNRYESINELSTDVVYGILEDEKNNLWLSTNDGIIRFNPAINPPVTHFTIEDGLQSNEYNGGAYYKSGTGEIFFGGQYGFNSFFPDKVTIDTVPPKIILTGLKINNQVINPGEKSPLSVQITETKKLILKSSQNNLTFDFAALHYGNPAGNRYRYILEGFDKDWVDAGTSRSASYTSLPYKSYIFRVIASNSDGKWNNEGLLLQIKIRPPFYRTTFFLIFLSILIILMIYLVVKNRVNRENKQKEKLQKEIDKFTDELEQAKLQMEKQREEITVQKQEIKLREREQQDIMWFNEGLNKFSDLMSKNKGDLELLTKNTIKSLVDYVEAEQGGIYLLNDDNPNEIFLELTGSYAYSESRLHSRFLPGEGYIGTCFKEKNVIELNNPEKEYTSIKSGLGEEHPKYIAFVPIKMDEDTVGVIEIASFKKLKGYKISFIQKMAETLHSIIDSAKSAQKMVKMVEELKLKSEELTAQEEILKQNLEEMAESQQEAMQREDFLLSQAEEYASKEVMLQEEVEKLKTELEELKKLLEESGSKK